MRLDSGNLALRLVYQRERNLAINSWYMRELQQLNLGLHAEIHFKHTLIFEIQKFVLPTTGAYLKFMKQVLI